MEIEEARSRCLLRQSTRRTVHRIDGGPWEIVADLTSASPTLDEFQKPSAWDFG